MRHLLAALAAAALLSGCATQFLGAPKVSPRQCDMQCRAWGMDLAGMVAMGEYSTACICEVPGRTSRREVILDGAAAATGGAAGVHMQTQAAQQRQATRPR